MGRYRDFQKEPSIDSGVVRLISDQKFPRYQKHSYTRVETLFCFNFEFLISTNLKLICLNNLSMTEVVSQYMNISRNTVTYLLCMLLNGHINLLLLNVDVSVFTDMKREGYYPVRAGSAMLLTFARPETVPRVTRSRLCVCSTQLSYRSTRKLSVNTIHGKIGDPLWRAWVFFWRKTNCRQKNTQTRLLSVDT